jgi:undecaprenyl-diphosphatase
MKKTDSSYIVEVVQNGHSRGSSITGTALDISFGYENEVPARRIPAPDVTRRQRGWSFSRPWRGTLKRRELTWLFVGLAACVLLLVFLTLASEVVEGDTQAFDTKILQALRDPHDPSKPIGPEWIEVSLLDLTALGGPTVLTLVVLAVIGFLLLQTRHRTALFVVATWLSGELVTSGLKHAFNRPRPTIVPPLREVFSTSFPSGHAMESAIVYLTLGAILMRVAEDRLTKVYCLGIAVLLTVLVGTSRVYLGVHYPTDVIGGWTIGFAWASICWLVEERFETSAGIVEEKTRKP